MCCFSQLINSVENTRIFARSLPENRQALVYSMSLDTPKDVAMILPIPVAPDSGDDAVKFISFEKYPDFFTDLHGCFRNPKFLSRKFDGLPANAGRELKVHEVGAFNASFVPTIKDFSRLDAQFRLADGVWEKLDGYGKYGFAVFKLRKGRADVHPMAFTFPTALVGKVFFPTVHIHDGEVHARADFDHVLYCQKIPGDSFAVSDWKESPELPASAVNIVAARGIVDPRLHVYGKTLKGRLPNTDTVLA